MIQRRIEILQIQHADILQPSDRTADVPGVLQSQVPPFEPVAYLMPSTKGGTPCCDATTGAEDPEDAERQPVAEDVCAEPTVNRQ